MNPQIRKIIIWENPTKIGKEEGDKARIDMDIFTYDGKRVRLSRVKEEDAINWIKMLFLDTDDEGDE